MRELHTKILSVFNPNTNKYEEIDTLQGGTPQKGIDYWTDADQEQIVQDVIKALGTPVFGTVDENCNVNLTGTLADGKTYTFTYEDENGNIATIGTYTKTAPPKYTNVIPISVGRNGTVFNGVGYLDGYYISGNSSGDDSTNYIKAIDGYFATGFFPYTIQQAKDCVPFYIKGVDLDSSRDYSRVAMYASYTDTIFTANCKFSNTNTNGVTVTKLADKYYKITPNTIFYTTGGTGAEGWETRGATLARMSLPGSGEGVIVTVNEPIE